MISEPIVPAAPSASKLGCAIILLGVLFLIVAAVVAWRAWA